MTLVDEQSIHVGDIVMITGHGNDKFLVCNGWFTYQNSRRYGWYFKLIPSGDILPDFEVDLSDVTVISCNSSSGGCDCPDVKPPHPGHKPGPPLPFNVENIEGAFTTVDTIEERNALCVPFPPDGKIVRVNDVRDEVKYYIWDAENLRWNDFEFPISDTLNQKLDGMEERIQNLETNSSWTYLSDLVMGQQV